MKKMTLGLAAVMLLAACGAQDDTAETTGNDTESGTEQQAAPDAANGDDSTSEDDASEQAAPETSVESDDTSAQSSTDNSTIREFDLELEFTNDQDWDFDFNRDGEASIERDDGEKVSGQAAQDEFSRLFQAVQFTTERPLEEIKREVLDAVGAEQDVRDFEMDVKFDSGEEIEIDHDVKNGESSQEVGEFSLDLEFVDGSEASYEYESDEQEAEIERRDGSESEGVEAREELEQLLGELSVTMDRSIDDMKAEVLNALSIDASEVDDFELDISYRGGEEIKFAHDLK